MNVNHQTSRRAVLRRVAAVGATMLGSGLAQSNPRCFDTHHHVLPPEYVKQIGGSVIGAPGGRLDAPPWSVAASLEMMDRLGIETAITSVSAPGFPLADLKAVQRLARTCNQFSKQMTVDHPRRFGMFATLPLPDVNASLAEVKYAFEELSADGIVLYTNYRDAFLGEPQFLPVMEELNRRKAVVFVHPTVCKCTLGVQPGIPASIIEFPHDTTRTIVSMLFHGTFQRCPNIRFIFSHAGGTLPFLVNRIATMLRNPEPDPEGVARQLRQLYFDLALSANPQAMRPLLGMVDVSHVLVGTDFPFAPPANVRAAVEGIASASLDDGSVRKIQRENALGLFPRFSVWA